MEETGTTMGTAMATENDEPHIPDDRPLFRTLSPGLEARSGSQTNGCGTLAYGPQKEANGEHG